MAPSSAGAATQIGETFTPTNGCGGEGGVTLQTVSPAGQYAAPTAGVITSWSLQADAFPPRLKLKVARPAGGNDFTIVGESEVQTTSANQLNTFPTQISVQAGDLIGEVRVGSGDCGRNEPGYFTQFLVSDPPLGSTNTYGIPSNFQLDLSATLEPDCDGDGLGDETQDPQVPPGGPCPIRARTLTLDANKNKVKKGKKVLLSGQLDAPGNEAACESSLAVELQRKKPTQTAFTTLEQLGTDAAAASRPRRTSRSRSSTALRFLRPLSATARSPTPRRSRSRRRSNPSRSFS